MTQLLLLSVYRAATRSLCVEDSPDDYPIIKAAIQLTELCFALQFETNAAFDQFRTKAALAARVRRGSSSLINSFFWSPWPDVFHGRPWECS